VPGQTLDRARRGDLAAFNELVLEYQGLVFNVCLRMLGDWGAAEDAAQEAFVSAWRNLKSMRGDQFRSWLLRIASNVCLDELRRRRRRAADSLETALAGGVPHPQDPDPLPESAALGAELRAGIEDGLMQLPEDQRLAVVLCDIEGLAYEEIARVTGANVGTVKSRLSRGRARLRELLLARPELLPAQFRQESKEVP